MELAYDRLLNWEATARGLGRYRPYYYSMRNAYTLAYLTHKYDKTDSDR